MRFEGGRLLRPAPEVENRLLIIGVAMVQPTTAEKSFADFNQLGIDAEICFAEEGIERKDGTSHDSHERPDDTEKEDAKESTGKLPAVLQRVKSEIPACPCREGRKQP